MDLKEYQEAKNIAFKYVVYKRRTVNEVREKLKKLEIADDIIDKVIEELICFEYLDDAVYVEKFVAKSKKDSVNVLRMKLLNKGIDKEIIDDYFNNNTFDEVEKIVSLLQKKKFSNELDTDQKDKIKAYCARKGFKISDIEKATKML